MEVLLIIGNGFDLSIGAKTDYNSFYEFMKKCNEAEDYETFAKSVDKAGMLLLKEFYDKYKSNIGNYFIEYFINFNYSFKEWVAFESELTRIITSMDALVSCLKDNKKILIDEYLNIFLNIDDQNVLSVLNNNCDNKFFKVFTSQGDLIVNEGRVKFRFKEEAKNYYELLHFIKKFCEDFPNDLFRELSTFSDLFKQYLNVIKSNTMKYNLYSNKIKANYVISYNYTEYLLTMYENKNFEPDDYIFINGKTSVTNEIVFGIDSSSKLENEGFTIFMKSVQRLFSSTDINRMGELKNDLIDTIMIIGHSLCLSDKDSLNLILSSKYSGYIYPTINVYYHNEESKKQLAKNLRMILGNKVFDEYQLNNKIKMLNVKELYNAE